jgi:hypothetical protein
VHLTSSGAGGGARGACGARGTRGGTRVRTVTQVAAPNVDAVHLVCPIQTALIHARGNPNLIRFGESEPLGAPFFSWLMAAVPGRTRAAGASIGGGGAAGVVVNVVMEVVVEVVAEW